MPILPLIRPCAVRLILACGMGMAQPLTAQTRPEGLDFTTVSPPLGEGSAAYQATVTGRVQTQATYATEVRGGRLTVDSRAPQVDLPQLRPPVLTGNWALLAVIGGLALGLVLWLRFGGGGVLASAPKADRPRAQPPAAWDMASPADRLTGETLLADIVAMPDRRAAMVRLLRHCLLRAAELSDTRLARSDTERRVLARLPASLSVRSDLSALLSRAELAHYGGRPVSDGEFAASLATARALLLGGTHAA